MNDYLTNLILTNLNLAPTLQPRIPALFEPESSQASLGDPEPSENARNETIAPVQQTETHATPPMPLVSVEREARNAALSQVRADLPTLHVERTPRIDADVPTPSRAVSELPREPDAPTLNVPRAVVVRPQVKTIVEPASIERVPIAPQASTHRPIIRVTIGRVDVHAVQTPAPISPKKKAESSKMSLDEYLKRRER